jgi:hypothetical protein
MLNIAFGMNLDFGQHARPLADDVLMHLGWGVMSIKGE